MLKPGSKITINTVNGAREGVVKEVRLIYTIALKGGKTVIKHDYELLDEKQIAEIEKLNRQ